MRGSHSVITSVDITADGALLMTAGHTGSPDIKLHRASDRMLLRTIHVDALQSAAISPDGQFVGASCQIGPAFCVAIWRASTGQLLQRMPAFDFSQTVAFTADSTRVVAHDGRTGLCVWHVADGALITTLAGTPNVPFAISPDGLEIAQFQNAYEVDFFSTGTGTRIRSLQTQDTSYAARFFGPPAYSPDGSSIVLRGIRSSDASLDGWAWTVAIFNAATGAYMREWEGGPEYELQSVAFPSIWRGNSLYTVVHSVNGLHGVYLGANPYHVSVIDASTGMQNRLTGLATLSLWYAPMAVSANGGTVVVGGSDQTSTGAVGVLGVHDAVAGALLPVTPQHRSAVTAAAFSPDGSLLATGSMDHTVKLWNRADGSLVRTIPVPQAVGHLAFSPDGAMLAVSYGTPGGGPAPYAFEVRGTGDGSVLLSASTPYGEITEALFTHDGTRLVTTDAGGFVRVWRVSDGAVMASEYLGSSLQCIAMSPDGGTVAVSPYGSFVYFLRVPDLAYIGMRASTGDAGPIRSLAFTPDGSRLIASGGGNSYGSLWAFSMADRSLAWSVTTMPGPVFAMAVDPRGQVVAAASGNIGATGDAGKLYFHNVSDGALATSYDQEAGSGLYAVPDLEFAPDGRSIAYCRYDGAVIVAQNPFAGDTVPPTTTAVVTPAPNSAGWTNGPSTTVSFTAADNPGGSGLKSITYQVENFPVATQVVSPCGLQVSMEGTRWVKFHAEDNLGNVEPEQTLVLHMDRTAPASTATINGAAPAGLYGASPVVAITATDTLSGVKVIVYTVDGGTPQAYGGPFAVTGDGAHTVTYWAVDAADNAETAHSAGFLIDATPPTTTAVVTPTPNSAGWTNGPNTTVSFTAADNPGGSGLKSITYQVENFPAVTQVVSPCGLQVSMEGTRWVKFHAEDNLGNVEPEQTLVLHMDRTAPAIVAPDVYATATSAGGAVVTFPVPNATDALSGLDGPVTTSPASGSQFPLGASVVDCRATDVAGNTGHAPFTVKVTYAGSFYLAPIKQDGSSVFKLGSTVQVKFQLTGPSAGVTDAAATFSFRQLSSSTGSVTELPDFTTPDTQFRYDPTTSLYILRWSTKGLTTGTYELKIDLGDQNPHTVVMGLR